MTRQILIAIYILMVLALSGAVKASTGTEPLTAGHGLIQSAIIDESQGVINVHGTLPTPCHSKPTIVVNRISNTKNLIELDVITTLPRIACVQMLGSEFDVALDLKSLPLESEKSYTVIFQSPNEQNGASNTRKLQYTAHAHLEGFVKQNVDQHSLKGLLVYFSNPTTEQGVSGYALQEGMRFLPVAPTAINLDRFQNKAVHISGYVVNNSVVPVEVSTR